MVAASLLFHLAVVAFALTRARRPVTPSQRPLQLTVVEVVGPAPAPLPAPEPLEVQPTPPPRRSPPTRAPKAPPPTVVAEPAPAPAPSPPSSDVPRAVAAPPPSAPSPRLLPRADLALEPPSAPSELALTEEQAKGGLKAPEIPQDLAQHLAREAVGKAKVKRGLVHPYYSDLGKAMLKHWDAERAVSQKGLRGFGENFRDNSRLGMRMWQENAQRFAGSGSPLVEGEDEPVRMPEKVSAGVDETLARRQALRRQGRQEWRSSKRAEIRVVQDARGKIVAADLVKPSRDPNVDKEAVRDVRAAAEAMPPPPPELLAGREQLVSHWLFELVVSINPPVPTFSFEFDEALGYIDPRLPLDRRIYKRVRLLAVD
jgi:outer membrane biosynthesis protein TonB